MPVAVKAKKKRRNGMTPTRLRAKAAPSPVAIIDEADVPPLADDDVVEDRMRRRSRIKA